MASLKEGRKTERKRVDKDEKTTWTKIREKRKEGHERRNKDWKER